MFDLCAIGNALVDIIVKTPDGFLIENRLTKGAMTLVEPATSSALFARAGASVEFSSGGSSANTLAGAASLGSRCAFLGKIGGDQFGEVFVHDLQSQHVHFSAPLSPDLPTGHCLIFVTPDAQRTMMTCLGAATEFGPDDVDGDLVQDAAVTYLEGYLFDKPLAQQAFMKAAKLVHEAERKLSLTLSDTFCVTRHREAFLKLVTDEIDILFANENEIKALYQTDDLGAAIDAVRKHIDIAVVTRSEKGAIVASGAHTYEVPAKPVAKVVDTTGAGDLYAAGFLYGLTEGRDLPECAKIGAIAASEVISHYGPRPQVKLSSLI